MDDDGNQNENETGSMFSALIMLNVQEENLDIRVENIEQRFDDISSSLAQIHELRATNLIILRIILALTLIAFLLVLYQQIMITIFN